MGHPFPNSQGWGPGAWGLFPWGDGPYLTYPYTPGVSYVTGARYDVAVHPFDDLSEQRYLRSRERGQELTYRYDFPSSGLICEIGSWWAEAGGPYGRFRAVDHRTGIPYVVRFVEPDLAWLRGPGLVRQPLEVRFRVLRDVTLFEQVTANSPASYWRLADTDASTAVDATGGTNHGRLMGGGRLGALPGLCEGDFHRAATASSLWIMTGSLGIIPQNATYAVLCRHVAPGAPGRVNRLLEHWFTNGEALHLELTVEGYARVIDEGGLTVVAREAPLVDDQRHLVVYRRGPSFGQDLLVDGAVVASSKDIIALTATAIRSAAIGTASATLAPNGMVIDQAWWIPRSVSDGVVSAWWTAVRRP